MNGFKRITLLGAVLVAGSVQAFDTQLFLQRLQEPAPAWMTEQIEADLKPFTTQLSLQSLNDFATTDHKFMRLFRIRVVDGVMTVEKGPYAQTCPVPNAFIPHFQELNRLAPLPDLDILVASHDGIGHCVDNKPRPIFSFVKFEEDPGTILIPDWFALLGYEEDKSRVLQGNEQYPWEKKSDRLYFRGGDSGIKDATSYETWKQSPRPQLALMSLQYPDLIDARFALSLHHRQFIEAATADGLISDQFVQMNDYVAHKYLMDLDGNCASAPRFALLLHSNGVILKHKTNSIQWFYKNIKPYVHFIPVEENLSDLLTQLEWAKNHTPECQQISQNAQQLARDFLKQETSYEFLYRLLCEYSKRQAPHYDEQNFSQSQARAELKKQYTLYSQTPSDINEHLPTLRDLASECETVIELGVRSVVSTWGLLQGLAENNTENKNFIGVDIAPPPVDTLNLARNLSEKSGISFDFWQANDMDIDIPNVDLLFIDTLHTYVHLSYELDKFCSKANKYIVVHDTSPPCAYTDCPSYQGNWSEYPAFIDKSKKGLWPAVEDFLVRHPEWVIHKRYENNFGLTVLKPAAN